MKIPITSKEFSQLAPIADIVLDREFSKLILFKGVVFEYMLTGEEYGQKKEEESNKPSI